MQTLLFILSLVLVGVGILILIILFLWSWTIIKTKTPSVRLPKAILPYVYKALNIQKNSIVYNIGSGDGRALFYFVNLIPEAKYIGIENGPLYLLLFNFHKKFSKLKKNKLVQLKNKNFFNQDFSEATHIFMYLQPNFMDDLLPKLDRELKKGAILVSASFQFTLKQPIAEIDLEREGKFQLVKKLYVYEF